MKQSALSQKEQEVLKRYFLNEIQKQLQPYVISNTDYFDGELTITNLEQIADHIKLEFEHSTATNRIYLRDIPNSRVALNEQDLPEFIKCINLDGKNMQDIVNETGHTFTVITQPVVKITFENLGYILNFQIDYVNYKKSGHEYLITDIDENSKYTISNEEYATLVSKTETVYEDIPYSPKFLNYLQYEGPQLAGVDDAKWYDWEYKLRNTVIGLAYEQINEVISDIAHNHSGIAVDELIEQLDRKEPACKQLF